MNYLPGFSLLLAPAAAVAGDALWPYQAATAALLLAGLWLFGLLAESLAPRAPLSALALAALTPLTVSMSGAVLSDVPLFAAAMAALWRARALWSETSFKRWLPLAALLGFSCLLRPTGVALLLAVVLALALEQRWKLALLCYGAGCAFTLPFLIRNRLLTGQSLMYVAELAQPYLGASRLGALKVNLTLNLAYYLKFTFVTMLFRWPAEHPVLTAATVGVGAVATFYGLADGGWRGWKKVPALFLLLFAGAHLVWGKQAGRYMLPVLPLVFAYFLRGVASVNARAALAAACVSLALFAGPDLRVAKASLSRDSPVTRPAERTHAWIKSRTSPQDVLAAELDGRLHLLTGRPVVHLRRLFDPAEFAAWLAANRARYVVVTPGDFIMTTATAHAPNDPMPTAALSLLLSDPARYELAFADSHERTAIYRVK